MKKNESGFSVVEILIVIVVVGLVGGIGWFVYNRQANKDSQDSSVTTSTQSKDIETIPDTNDYVEFNDLKDVTFLKHNQWSGKTNRPQASLVSLFNFQPDTIKNELEADGRLPTNANFYHDVQRRDLESYPYSLDKMYEVQIIITSTTAREPLTRELIEGLENNIQDLQLYKVNGRLVADYIKVGDGNSLDQRKILIRNENGSKEVRLTINPDQSREKVTKENFDGLLELVGSITFKD